MNVPLGKIYKSILVTSHFSLLVTGLKIDRNQEVTSFIIRHNNPNPTHETVNNFTWKNYLLIKFKFKIGMNSALNKFYHINKEISLDSLNLAFVHFKKLMKFQYLKYGKTWLLRIPPILLSSLNARTISE